MRTKTLISILGMAVTYTLQASITGWSGQSASSLTQQYEGGMAYFLEVSETGPTLEQMIASIQMNGLGGRNENVSLLSASGLKGFYNGDTFLGTLLNTATGLKLLDPPIKENETSTYYVLFDLLCALRRQRLQKLYLLRRFSGKRLAWCLHP